MSATISNLHRQPGSISQCHRHRTRNFSRLANVGYRGKSGKHIFVLRITGFVMGFRRRPHCGRGGWHRGRLPKAAREGTRGRLGTISGAALWGFGCSGLSVCNRCGGGASRLSPASSIARADNLSWSGTEREPIWNGWPSRKSGWKLNSCASTIWSTLCRG
jgi:hypothetical protein